MKPQPYQFIGCDCDYALAKLVLFGVPFDGTTSYRPGTRFGPSHIRHESIGLETYSPYQEEDLSTCAVFDAGDLSLPYGNVNEVLTRIESFAATLLEDEKIPVMLGGEHLISLGLAKALIVKYPNLKVIHLDAHCDLRETFLGERLSHATVMRRIWELLPPHSIMQLGIRSGDQEEFEFAKKEVWQTRYSLGDYAQSLKVFANEPIYLSLDLDVLDPSIMPGTGTPEAGGITFHELMGFIKELKSYNIVAMDINELSPLLDSSQASTALAGKIVRELLISRKGVVPCQK
ncbi:MAG: agmatinase [Erysipelotrichaceae bacterium]